MKNVGVVYAKEMKDAMRDPRTLFLMIIFPLIINPLLFFFITKTANNEEQEINKTHVVVALQGGAELAELRAVLSSEPNMEVIESANPQAEVQSKRAAAGVVVPAGAAESLRQGRAVKLTVVFDGTRGVSRHARDLSEDGVKKFDAKATAKALSDRGQPADLARLVTSERKDAASASRQAGYLLGLFLPYFLTLSVANGVTSTAIDVTSGEKDRNTLETVLVSSAGRSDILVGKLLAVVTTGFVAVISSAISMAAVMMFGSVLFGTAAKGMDMALSPGALVGVVLLSIPLAVLFSAVLMALGCFAKSAKEGQTQAVYVQMAIIFAGVSTLVKQTEPTSQSFMVPVLGTALAQRELLVGEFHPQHLIMAVLVSSVLAAVAIFVAVRLFGNEQVMFRSK